MRERTDFVRPILQFSKCPDGSGDRFAEDAARRIVEDMQNRQHLIPVFDGFGRGMTPLNFLGYVDNLFMENEELYVSGKLSPIGAHLLFDERRELALSGSSVRSVDVRMGEPESKLGVKRIIYEVKIDYLALVDDRVDLRLNTQEPQKYARLSNRRSDMVTDDTVASKALVLR